MKKLFKIDFDQDRIYGLDILRAIAILFVVIEHGTYFMPIKIKRILGAYLIDGVTVFFVLSGFLVGGIFIKTIAHNGLSIQTILNFWKRRWYRTLPNYFLVLILLCVLNILFTPGFAIQSVSKYFIFAQNIFSEHPPFFPEAWSLSVEEWFYVLLPLSIVFTAILPGLRFKHQLAFILITVIVGVTVFRYYKFNNVGVENFKEWNLLFRKQVITRLDSIMYGLAGAYIYYYHQELWKRYHKQLFILGVVMFYVLKIVVRKYTHSSDLYTSVFSFSLYSMATLFVLPYLSQLKTGNGIFYKFITYTSICSYSMYLLGYSVIQFWIIGKIPWSNWIANPYVIYSIQFVLYWILLWCMSIGLYKYFEKPMTSLRDKY
jgi:peptidoglycan/LPS O-acetylase OafA/YrhL